ncbi:MAG TPA: cellulase family glycosylhydrolase [Chloroflexota bacterium]
MAALIAFSLVQLTGMRPAAATLAVRVSGNHLVDGAGNRLALHGANLSGTEFACDQSGGPSNRGWSIYGNQPLDQLSTYQAMAAWNINVVRVPLNEDCWLNINGVNPAYGGSTYQSAIATEVGLIHQAGMIAILDLHWNAPGAWAAIAQQPMADADHSVSFWQQVAGAYRNDAAVIFDLYNEPFLYGSYFTNPAQDAWACWLSGCSLNQFISAGQTGPSGQSTGYTTSYTWSTAGMQTLVDAIRATGATQPVLVNGVDWANDDSGWLAHAPHDAAGQLIAGAHDYPGETCQTASCWDAQQAPISATYPFLVGETGDHVTAPVAFLPSFLPYADSHGWNYLAWTWNPWSNPDDVLITSWSGTPNAGEGTTYQQHLAAFGGSHPTPTPTGTPTGTPAPSATATPSPTATPTATPTPGPGSAIKGGLNVEPSIRPSHYAGANPQSWWCVMPNCTSDFNVNGQGPMATVTQELQAAKAVGSSWVRLEIPWPVIEPASGVFDWSRMDAIMQASQATGEQILPVPMWTPQWAGGGSGLNVPASNVADWTAFITQLAQRYGAQVPAIDIWNEPDSGSYLYNGSAQTYVSSLLNPAYSAIKAVNPSIPVVEAGSANEAGSCCPFLTAVLADGGKFDIASYHNYAGTYGSEASSYRSLLNANGRSSTPIWMTEYGVQSATGNQSSAIQSVLGGSEPLQAAAWYNLRDTASWTCCPPAQVDTATWGLLTATFSQKASYGVMHGYLGGGSNPTPTPSPTPTPTPTPSPTAPSTPTGLTASAVGATQVDLNWNASSGGPTSYTITRGGATLAFVSAPTTTFVDSTVSPSTTYTYTVSAANSSGASAQSAPVSVTTPATGVLPLPSIESSTQFTVSWSAQPDVTTYQLWTSVDGSPWVPYTSPTTATSIGFDGAAGHSYAFRVAPAGGSSQGAPQASTTVSPSAARSQPFSGLDAVDGYGFVHEGDSPPLFPSGQWTGWDIVRGIQLDADGLGGVTLDGFGGLHTAGNAPTPHGSAYWPGWDIATGVAGNDQGGWVLDGFGGLHPYSLQGESSAPAVVGAAYWPGWKIARAVVRLGDGSGGLVLDGFGGVHSFGVSGGPAVASAQSSAYWSGWDIARALALVPGSTASHYAGYVLDGFGGLHPFASAGDLLPPAAQGAAYWSGWDIVTGVVVLSAGEGWTLDGYGGFHPFGGAPSVATPDYEAGGVPRVRGVSLG